MPIYPAYKTQIVLLIAEKVKVSIKYLNFSDIFLEKKTSILLKATNLNQHIIKLQKYQQLLYRSIYSLGLVELVTLKTYVETKLGTGFI